MKNTFLAISLLSTALFSCNKLDSQTGDDVCAAAAKHVGDCLEEDFTFNLTNCDTNHADYMLSLTCDEVRYGPEDNANADVDAHGRGIRERERDKGEICYTDISCDGHAATKTCRPSGDGYLRCLPKARLGRLCQTRGALTRWGTSDCFDDDAVCMRVDGMVESYNTNIDFWDNVSPSTVSKEGICRLPVPGPSGRN